MTLATDQIEIDVAAAKPSGAWPAIIGGALAAAAISLILMVLGAGLGLSAISPWTGLGAGAATVAVGSVIWLVVVQWVASGLGGYLAGRLRHRASDAPDEVFFRDTANGFLAWALATLLVAALLTSALSAIVGAGTQAVATVAGGAAQGATQGAASLADPTGYYIDALFRPAPTTTAAAAPTTTAAGATAAAPTSPMASPTAPAAGGSVADVRPEVSRILANDIGATEFPPADLDYLSQLIASRTGVSTDEARQRVTATVQNLQKLAADAKTAADDARKAASHLALYMFLSLIVGAFIAATAAALGGAHRDEQPATMMR